jgi:Putative zinc-finger
MCKEQIVDTVTFHESEDRLELYALRRLPDSEVELVENHLLVCGACRERLEEVSAFAFSMRATLKDHPVMKSGTRRFAWLTPQLGMAGAFAAILLAVGIFWASRDAHILPVASLQLTALRGSEIKTVVRARELDLAFTDASASSRLDIVDAGGITVWTGTLRSGAGRVEAKITQVLTPGDYFARVSTGPGQPQHEYQFRVVR